ncbi:acyl-CoA dehydrogenase family protein [Kribbella shirazensis]|uniref:Alkylation response protein AidB-like acyl-CoA dehydrogenase n=1 Tax=Kribbella shirazensis TaxID=1105143 RepID=A0A7X5VI13_9ACTN|nr:acyl-CoA dehydrogenase family protein [Kribbella shirazensis]NIK61439.1 alkylation response protein AidB-like acyl-CoA dehydrogenase [Kribbella shirazensis]
MSLLQLSATTLPRSADALRSSVRGFLAEEREQGRYVPRCDNWLGGIDPEFSRRLGERGFLGLTWPRRYGGQERSPLERFAVTEELLAAGAPVAAHWVSDRQVGPNLLRFGSEDQKRTYLPGIACGQLLFCIGMSEPDSGSDLASVRTQATRAPGGWVVNGSKVWTSGAHVAQAMVALVRTTPEADRHDGLSQLIVDMAAAGVQVNPIRSIDGGHHFNEVVLQDVFVPDEHVLGRIGDGWRQVTSELAYERSGPERLMSTLPLLLEWCKRLRESSAPIDTAYADAVGQLVARCWTLRQMSLAVAAGLADGAMPATEAAMVKDLGAQFEREVIEVIRRHIDLEPDAGSDDPLTRLLAEAILHSPAFTLRGGTTEILRKIVASSLGAR